MQKWNPEQYAQHARFVSDLGGPVVDLLAPNQVNVYSTSGAATVR
jgi:hypothetical protein